MSGSDKKSQRLIVGGIPRAELLPPEIKQDKVSARQRSNVIAALVLLLFLVGLAYAGSTAVALSAQANLAAEQERGAQLLAKQNDYAEAKETKATLTAAQQSLLIASAPEVDWASFISDYLATFPAGATVESISATFTPEAVGTIPSPLYPPGLIEIIAVVNTPTVPDSAAWLSRISALPGFNDYAPSSLASTATGYATTVTIHLSAEALWLRYFPDSGQSADDDSESSADSDTDSSTDTDTDSSTDTDPDSSTDSDTDEETAP